MGKKCLWGSCRFDEATLRIGRDAEWILMLVDPIIGMSLDVLEADFVAGFLEFLILAPGDIVAR